MENNNNNGRGIFYGVIGVATLVVAIIGATFAYFSASVTKNNITNIQSATLRLEIPTEKSNFQTDMIPVETDGDNGAIFARYIGLTENKDSTDRLACKDNVNNSICSVYEFTVKNPDATTAQTVVGSMKVSANTFENLYYAVFKGADSAITTAEYQALNGAATTTVLNGTTGASQQDSPIGSLVVAKARVPKTTENNGVVNWPNTLETLTPGEETTYTVVVWIEETGSDQTSVDGNGKNFAAGITFTSNTGNGVTGIITAS